MAAGVRNYRGRVAGGKRFLARTVADPFPEVSALAGADTFQSVGMTISGGAGTSGVTYSSSSTTVIDVVLVGSDPGAHGLHVDHTHPARFFEEVTITAVADGAWEDTATWDLGRVPTTGDVVRIPNKLTIDTAGNRKLTCNLLAVNTDGELVADFSGTSNTCEFVFADTAIDTDLDPGQWGHGFLGLGTVTVRGQAKTPWLRLATEALAGAATITLSSAPTNWAVGDRLVLPDTRQQAQVSTYENPAHTNHLNQGQFDERTITDVTGAVVTLSSALTYDHKGARDGDGAITFPPAVMNLTRNVLVRSASASGTRPHLLSHGRAAIDVRYTELKNTGRSLNDPWNNVSGSTPGTNQQGRYGGWHFHHTIGPLGLAAEVYQFRFEGNACWNESGIGVTPPRWGITVHGSHYGLVKDNCVYNWSGAGVVTEDGSETENLFQGNYVVRVPFSGTGENSRGGADVSHGGQAFWFGGAGNRVKDNLSASSFKGYAVVPFVALTVSGVRIPSAKGKDPLSGVAADYTSVNIQNVPLLEWSGNECCGRLSSGIELWRVNNYGSLVEPAPSPAESVLLNQNTWHVDHSAYYNYETEHVTFDGLVARNDFALLRAGQGNAIALFFSDYQAPQFEVKNSNIQGFPVGFLVATNGGYTARDSTFRNYRDIEIRPLWSTLSSAVDVNARDTTIDNVVHEDPACSTFGNFGWQGRIRRDGTIFAYNTNHVIRDRCYVTDFNGSVGDDFRLYYPEQAAGQTMPDSYDPESAIVRRGTAQGGGANTITLDASASGTNDFYLNKYIAIVVGTGLTVVGRLYRCTAYDGTTKVATVTPNWETAPDNTSRFVVNTGGYVRRFGSPDTGRTNQQNFDDYGICTAGEITSGVVVSKTGVYGDCVEV
jgi:hypothetical protein